MFDPGAWQVGWNGFERNGSTITNSGFFLYRYDAGKQAVVMHMINTLAGLQPERFPTKTAALKAARAMRSLGEPSNEH